MAARRVRVDRIVQNGCGKPKYRLRIEVIFARDNRAGCALTAPPRRRRTLCLRSPSAVAAEPAQRRRREDSREASLHASQACG